MVKNIYKIQNITYKDAEVQAFKIQAVESSSYVAFNNEWCQAWSHECSNRMNHLKSTKIHTYLNMFSVVSLAVPANVAILDSCLLLVETIKCVIK